MKTRQQRQLTAAILKTKMATISYLLLVICVV